MCTVMSEVLLLPTDTDLPDNGRIDQAVGSTLPFNYRRRKGFLGLRCSTSCALIKHRKNSDADLSRVSKKTMPTPRTSSSSSNGSDKDLLAPSPPKKKQPLTSRPFTTTGNNKNGRPIYGRRSKSYDPRLNSRVTNEERVPLDVRIIQSSSLSNRQENTLMMKEHSLEHEVRHRKRSEETIAAAAGMRSTSWLSTKDCDRGASLVYPNHDDEDALELCKESMSPDVADYQIMERKREDDPKVVGGRSKSSKRRLSYTNQKEEENDHLLLHEHDVSLLAKKTSREKNKRQRMKRNVNDDDENIRPNHHPQEEEENLSFTETSEQEEHIQQSKSNQRRRSSTGTKAIIAIQPKSKKGGVVIPSTKSYIKELRDLAKKHNGTATQYKATYHTGVKPIIDKNVVSTIAGSGRSSSTMIQVGQLIIKETSVTYKGNKGGNSYSFEGWKLPGSKQRDSSIYDSTRPKLIEHASSAMLMTSAPYLIVDTALSTEDAARVRRFVMEAESGQTPMEFFACMDDNNSEDESDDVEGEEALFGGSMVSEEEHERGVDQGRKVLGDRSNTADCTRLKDKDQTSPDMKLSNKYHKARTKSARKKRKSAHTSPTEPRNAPSGLKKRKTNSIVRFYVPDSKGDSQKCFGFIEGIGGGLEERLSNVTPHRGRLLELPGSVLSGQWETRLVKEKTGGDGNEKSLRISLRHESSSLKSIENFLAGKESPDGHFVSIVKPAVDRTFSLIHQGVVLEEEIEVDNVGREQISNDAFIGCVSLVVFDGFLSASEAVAESRDVASRFLQNCVPSNELQSGRELYGIVGNEHNSNDDENITGMLFPCNVSFESDHVVLLLHDEEFQVFGIDVIFRPSKKWLRYNPLTEALLDKHLDHTGSDGGDDEIMKRYIEKNIPSPMRPKPASIVSKDDRVQSEEEVEERSLDQTHSDSESLGFDNTAQPDFDVNNDDLSSVKDPNDDEKVYRLEEESRTLKQRIEILEEEKRLLEQQIVRKPLVDDTNVTKPAESVAVNEEFADETVRIERLAITLADTLEETTKVANSAEFVNDDSAAVNEIADYPMANESLAASQSQKKGFADLFGDHDSIIGELTNRQAHVEPSDLHSKAVPEKKNVVKDLFEDGDSLFGVYTKKQNNRRKSTGGLTNHRTSFQKPNRGRHSTGGLPNRRKSVGKMNSVARASTKAELIPASEALSQGTSTKKNFVSVRQTAAEKGSHVSSRKNKSSTAVTQTSRESTLPERTQTTKSNRRSTFQSKLRLSAGANTSVSKKSNVTVSRNKIKVADLFEDDCSMFGCAAKALSEKNRANKSISIEPSIVPNDMNSVSSLGGGSFSFESMSPQSLGRVHSNAVTDERNVNPTQPLFDIYFGKEMEESTDQAYNQDAVSILEQAGTQPFFDYYFGQDLSGTNDDESTQYSIQPFHSVYYGRGFDDQSFLHSITSSFEIPIVPPSLYYFDNDGIVPDCVLTARPPFFDHYFGQLIDDEEESSPLVWSSSIASQQLLLATEHPPFYDHFYGQEDFDGQERNVATKTSWRCWLAACFKFLVIGVLPAVLPVALLVSKQYNTDFSRQFDVLDSNKIVGETTSSWWSLKPWE